MNPPSTNWVDSIIFIQSNFPSYSLKSLKTLKSLKSLRSLKSLKSLRSLKSLKSLRSLRSLRSLKSLKSQILNLPYHRDIPCHSNNFGCLVGHHWFSDRFQASDSLDSWGLLWHFMRPHLFHPSRGVYYGNPPFTYQRPGSDIFLFIIGIGSYIHTCILCA